jgi:hypothetical protein
MTTATETTNEDLRAYHGDQALKEETIAKARMHREAGDLVKDVYAEGGKVCAVGCLTEDPNGGHDQYPTRWGIPTWMAYLEEGVFVGLPDEKAKLWPERFLTAIPAGADFDGLAERLAIRRLKEECLPLSGEWPESIRAQVVAAIELTIAALEGKKSLESAESARSAARSAAWSARSAESAESAAESAARSAASAAESAESAESATYEREADHLIAELEALPVTGVTAE